MEILCSTPANWLLSREHIISNKYCLILSSMHEEAGVEAVERLGLPTFLLSDCSNNEAFQAVARCVQATQIDKCLWTATPSFSAPKC